jgi:hypothetical protein
VIGCDEVNKRGPAVSISQLSGPLQKRKEKNKKNIVGSFKKTLVLKKKQFFQ